MFTFETIPHPLRRFVAEGLGRLIYYLADLAEDVRRGLIEAVSRTVSESVAGVMSSVIRGRPGFGIAPGPTTKRASEISSEKGDNSAPYENVHDEHARDKVFEHARHDFDGVNEESFSQNSVIPHTIPAPSDSPYRLVLATGLGSVALWLRSFGMTPLATAVSVLAGAILLFPG